MNNDIQIKARKQRLFIAVDIDPWQKVLSRIQKQLQQLLPANLHNISWYPVKSFHITLVFIGYVTHGNQQLLKTTIENELKINPFLSFKINAPRLSILSGRHIVVEIESEQLNKLYKIMKICVPENLLIRQEREYKAHLALGKFKKSHALHLARQIIDSFDVHELKSLDVKEFHLYESKPHREYHQLVTFPLGKQNAK